VVRGQFRAYRDEKGVSPASKVETYAAVRLEINSWRWKGVPFFLRAGKCLPVTCTEVMVHFRQPPAVYGSVPPPPNHLRFRISPEVAIGLGVMVKGLGERLAGNPTELRVCHDDASEMGPYERLLGEAMAGDARDFAREDYVEAAWRVVQPVLGDATPVHEYKPGAWGPNETAPGLTPPGGWHDLTPGDCS
jgi:glucose-6-phosphate 1-dehydrogenase